MPFNAALSAGEITQVRKTNQAFEHYLLVNPNDIVWQAEVNDTKSAENYASFTWANTQSGTRTDSLAGMVLFITTGKTDFTDPVFRGRVRTAPNATTVFVNENGVDIDDTMYVTVIDDFDIMERLQRLDGDGAKYKDWDIAYVNLPPVIDGLQSVYADFSGANPVTFSFAPTATASADGAAIDTWLWDVGDGTITVGTAASQNITATFPGFGVNEHRWVHLTVTDDNNVATVFHFEVYTVNKQSSTAVKLDTGELQITGTIEEGWNAIITAWDGMALTEVLDQTRVAIAGIDNYDGTATPIVSNIMMVGRLRTENSQTTSDELATTEQDTSFTIEGFATQLARLPAPALSIEDAAAPDEWGEMTDPTPYRASVYYLAYHTTFVTLSSISTDDFSTYVLGDFSLGETTGLDSVNKQLDSANGIAVFAPAGETTLRRKASYQTDADRAGLTTVFDFTTADLTPSLAQDYEYGETVGEIEAGAVTYNTTNNEIDYRYIGRAPAASFGSGHESVELNGQVLEADQNDTNSRAELVQRTADHLAYVNPKVRLDVGLMDGFWFAIPTLHQRWTFTLAATDTARGRVYADTDNWQLLSITYSADNVANTRELTATFEEETQGENAGVAVTLVPDINALDFALPPISPYDSFPDDPLTNFPIDDPDLDPYYGGGMTAAMEPTPNNDSPINTEILNIPMWYEQSRATTRNTENGEAYTITVEGMSKITDQTTWEETFDFTVDAQGWELLTGYADTPRGTYVAGVGWQYTDTGIRIHKDFSPLGVVNKLDCTYSTTGGPGGSKAFARGWGQQGTSAINDVADPSTWHSQEPFNEGTDLTLAYSDSAVNSERLFIYTSANSMNMTLYKVVAGGTGSNPFNPSESGATFGDAFYEWVEGSAAALYAALTGLLINGAKPGTIGPYRTDHVYVFTATGTGAPFSFSYKLGDYSDVTRNILRVTVNGPNMGLTT